ncbi:MAG: arginase family protein [Candidatus Micrarchaeota archaeon]
MKKFSVEQQKIIKEIGTGLNNVLTASSTVWEPLYTVEEAEWIILGIPYIKKTRAVKDGCEKAPKEIRKWSRDFWTYDPKTGRDLFDEKIVDLGDIKAGSFESTFSNARMIIDLIRKKNKNAKILFLGGDHAVSEMTVKSIKPKSALVFDAHMDLMNEYDKSGHSRACTSRRIYEQTGSLALRGIRAACLEEHEYAKKNKIDWRSDLKELPREAEYMSIDIDVLDPCYIGTGAPEAFGATFEQLAEAVRSVKFKYCDIVEWIPPAGYPYIIQLVKEILAK